VHEDLGIVDDLNIWTGELLLTIFRRRPDAEVGFERFNLVRSGSLIAA
jgi:hypothetical protein